jgi:hypothetical protein
MKIAVTAGLMAALLTVGVGIGRASEKDETVIAKDETVITVQVTSAEHELQEGYFALGEQGTVMAKPGSDLFRFLSRQNGQKVKIVLTQSETRELSRLQK